MSSVSLAVDGAIDANRFDAWIGRLLLEQGQDIFRAKGILELQGYPQRFVFQAVHMQREGTFQRPWAEGERRTSRLVLIGRKLDEAALRQGFEACRA